MVSRKLRFQIGIFVLITLLGVSFVGIKYLGWFDQSYTVYVDAKATGGAYEHAAVAYRGVPVGRVGDVTVHGKGARLELHIESDVKIPKNSKVVVAQRSAVGEQYVDLRPATSDGPYLANGDKLSDVALPLPMETLLANLNQLLTSLDPDDVKVVINELGDAFEGNEDALDKMLDATQKLIDGAADHMPQTVELLRASETVLETQNASASAIRNWADKLAKLTTTVKNSDSDLRKLINTTPESTKKMTGLIQDLDPDLGSLLGNMISVNGVAARRIPNLKMLLVTYPMVVSGGFTVTPGDSTVHFGLVTNFDNPPPCVYADGDTGYHCTDGQKAAGASTRGWQNAPGPTGPPIVPVPLPADGSSKSDHSSGGSGSGSDSSEDLSQFGYDPLTGLLVDSDGKPVQFDATGGQYELAGSESWKQLILNGLTS